METTLIKNRENQSKTIKKFSLQEFSLLACHSSTNSPLRKNILWNKDTSLIIPSKPAKKIERKLLNFIIIFEIKNFSE